ncbi:MAG: hypothetical protein IPN94_18765 [Sphingobacteriales bacterium]|nr:hypothetical protein [Sphingobacteriales bacterium]
MQLLAIGYKLSIRYKIYARLSALSPLHYITTSLHHHFTTSPLHYITTSLSSPLHSLHHFTLFTTSLSSPLLMQNLSEKLYAKANGKTILLALAAFLVFNALILPTAEQHIKAYSGGVGVLDLQLGYTPDKAYDMVAAYGEQGRQLYAMVEIIADTFYPLIYTLFFCLLISFIYQKTTQVGTKLRLINLVPLLSMGFDYLENSCILTLLLTFPNRYNAVAQVGSVFTLLKWGSLVLVLGTVLLGLMLLLLNRPPKVA